MQNIPCSTAYDRQWLHLAQHRSGTARNILPVMDKGFKNDRIYASIFRTLLLTGAPSAMPQFSALNNTWQVAGQAILDAHLFAEHAE